MFVTYVMIIPLCQETQRNNIYSPIIHIYKDKSIPYAHISFVKCNIFQFLFARVVKSQLVLRRILFLFRIIFTATSPLAIFHFRIFTVTTQPNCTSTRRYQRFILFNLRYLFQFPLHVHSILHA